MRQPKKKRSKAQAASAQAWAASGRAAQATRRAYNIAHHLPTRTKSQTQASQAWAAAGRAAQARKRAGLPPLKKQSTALAGGAVGDGPLMLLAEPNRSWPCCAATAVATHLYFSCGILASPDEVLGLHLAAAGQDGARIEDLLEVARGGFAGTRLSQFWRVDDMSLPGLVAGLRLAGGAHASLLTGEGACVSWGKFYPVTFIPDETWWLEWETR